MAEQFIQNYGILEEAKVATFHDPASFREFLEFVQSRGQTTHIMFDPSAPGGPAWHAEITKFIEELKLKDRW